MNTTTHDDAARAERRRVAWLGAGLLLALVVVMMLMGRAEPLTAGVTFAIASVGAAGTLAMAWLLQRMSPYPRPAWWAAATVMAGAILLSVSLTGSPAAWKSDLLPMTWMFPWFVMVLGTTAGRREGICAGARPRAGWILVGMSVVVCVLLLAANSIADWISTLFRAR